MSTEERNGVRRPGRGITKDMWDLFDSATGPIHLEHLVALAQQKGWNLNLLRSHFRQHCTFHGNAIPNLSGGGSGAAKQPRQPRVRHVEPAPKPTQPWRPSKNLLTDAGARVGIEHLFKQQPDA